jgi:hypothetical protein
MLRGQRNTNLTLARSGLFKIGFDGREYLIKVDLSTPVRSNISIPSIVASRVIRGRTTLLLRGGVTFLELY